MTLQSVKNEEMNSILKLNGTIILETDGTFELTTANNIWFTLRTSDRRCQKTFVCRLSVCLTVRNTCRGFVSLMNWLGIHWDLKTNWHPQMQRWSKRHVKRISITNRGKCLDLYVCNYVCVKEHGCFWIYIFTVKTTHTPDEGDMSYERNPIQRLRPSFFILWKKPRLTIAPPPHHHHSRSCPSTGMNCVWGPWKTPVCPVDLCRQCSCRAPAPLWPVCLQRFLPLTHFMPCHYISRSWRPGSDSTDPLALGQLAEVPPVASSFCSNSCIPACHPVQGWIYVRLKTCIWGRVWLLLLHFRFAARVQTKEQEALIWSGFFLFIHYFCSVARLQGSVISSPLLSSMALVWSLIVH